MRGSDTNITHCFLTTSELIVDVEEEVPDVLIAFALPNNNVKLVHTVQGVTSRKIVVKSHRAI